VQGHLLVLRLDGVVVPDDAASLRRVFVRQHAPMSQMTKGRVLILHIQDVAVRVNPLGSPPAKGFTYKMLLYV
jgi:hypothetical protein